MLDNIFEYISDKHLNELMNICFEILCPDTEGENIFSYRSRSKCKCKTEETLS